MTRIRLHFTDYFDVDPSVLSEYGALNVSLINDLPLFIDPFLLFNSDDEAYQELHREMIDYLRFLRAKSQAGSMPAGLLSGWYRFPEIKQNWLGFSKMGNSGRGLGHGFSVSLYDNLGTVFGEFGSESVTTGSHIEKLCLIEDGVGRDGISDLTTNLIKGFLLEYTQRFALESLRADQYEVFPVDRVRFNYATESWVSAEFTLPSFNDDYVLLTPRNMLTRDDTWISRNSYLDSVGRVVASVSNAELRDKLNNYLYQQLPEDPRAKDYRSAAAGLARRYPAILDYYIRMQEEGGDEATYLSEELVGETTRMFIDGTAEFAALLSTHTAFYSTLDDTMKRVEYLKDVIENKGGHKMFYDGDTPIRRESDVHLLFRLTWFGTPHDVSREVNDGRGPADFKISRGALDKTIVEFKLASNKSLKRNLENQVLIYQAASDAKSAIKVIVFFSEAEHEKVKRILKDLALSDDPNVVLIDARADNKPSASKA